MADIGEYAEFLRGLKQDPSKVMVSAILAPSVSAESNSVSVVLNQGEAALETSCCLDGQDCSAEGGATPAIRLQGFLGEFPNRNSSASICEESSIDGLEVILESLVD